MRPSCPSLPAPRRLHLRGPRILPLATLALLCLVALSGCGDRGRAAAQARRQAQHRAALMHSAVRLHDARSPTLGRVFTLRRLGHTYRVTNTDARTLARASLRRAAATVAAKDAKGRLVGATHARDHAISLLDPQGKPLLTLRVEPDGLHLTLLAADDTPLHRLAFTPERHVLVHPICPPTPTDDPSAAPALACDDTPFTVAPASTAARRSPPLVLTPLAPSAAPDDPATDPADDPDRRIILEANSGLQPIGFALLNLPHLPLTHLLPLALHADRLGLPAPPALTPAAPTNQEPT